MFFLFNYYFNWISLGLLLCVDEVKVVNWVDYVEVKLLFFIDDDLSFLGWIGIWFMIFLLT